MTYRVVDEIVRSSETKNSISKYDDCTTSTMISTMTTPWPVVDKVVGSTEVKYGIAGGDCTTCVIRVLIGLMILISYILPRSARLLGNNPVSVLATLILLSYKKILRTLIAVF